jgi:pilus assembly protein Flp/PilA
MNTFEMLKTLTIDEDGADAVEYALLVSLIAVAIIVTVTALGGKINAVFNTVNNSLKTS